MRTNHWKTPLGLATRHDKARARALRLRREADRLDAKADALALEFDRAVADHRRRGEVRKAASA